MSKFNLFARIMKVDEAQRIVYGRAADETPDKTNEIFDYESSKPYFEAWSANASKVTDGKSLGNVRAMHGKVAAGKLDNILFADEDRAIDVAAKVVDDGEWKKVLEGVYTGFSIGGAYVKRWKDATDAEKTRYTADPVEISLVDLPCIPTATFQMIKADGVVEDRAFKAAETTEETPVEFTANQVAEKAAELAKAAGDETKWPEFIDKARETLTAEAAAAKAAELPAAPLAKDGGAASDIGAGEEWSQVWVHPRLPGQQFARKADMVKALQAHDAQAAADKAAAPVKDVLKGIDEALKGKEPPTPEKTDAEKAAEADAAAAADAAAPAAEKPAEKKTSVLKIVRYAPIPNLSKAASAELLSKSLYDVGRLASLILELKWFMECVDSDARYQDKDTIVPDQLKAQIAALAQILRTFVLEETAELINEKTVGDTLKSAAALVPDSAEHLSKVVAGTPELKTACEALDGIIAAMKADAEKSAGDGTAGIEKVTAERDALTKALADLTPTLNDVLERVKRIEATPLPGGPARTHVVDKASDGNSNGGGFDLEKTLGGMSDAQKADLAIRLAQQNPRPLSIAG